MRRDKNKLELSFDTDIQQLGWCRNLLLDTRYAGMRTVAGRWSQTLQMLLMFMIDIPFIEERWHGGVCVSIKKFSVLDYLNCLCFIRETRTHIQCSYVANTLFKFKFSIYGEGEVFNPAYSIDITLLCSGSWPVVQVGLGILCCHQCQGYRVHQHHPGRLCHNHRIQNR